MIKKLAAVFLPHSFVFPRGHCKDDTTEDLSLNNSVRCGFYSMKLYIDDQLYRQGTEERYIFEKLQIPAGTAYACGNNNIRNNYTATNHTIEGAQVRAGGSAYTYHFNDLQVGIHSNELLCLFVYLFVCLFGGEGAESFSLLWTRKRVFFFQDKLETHKLLIIVCLFICLFCISESPH